MREKFQQLFILRNSLPISNPISDQLVRKYRTLGIRIHPVRHIPGSAKNKGPVVRIDRGPYGAGGPRGLVGAGKIQGVFQEKGGSLGAKEMIERSPWSD